MPQYGPSSNTSSHLAMRIVEIFRSIQGEGRLTGVESIFVRTSGCNLRCWWCDTPYASWAPEGEDLSVAEILEQIDFVQQLPRPVFLSSQISPAASPAAAVNHVVLTGGEPMLFAELIPLTAALRQQHYHITVETSGTLYLPVACDLMSISPKLSNSTPPLEPDPRPAERHARQRHAPEVVRRLLAEYDCQLKFVVDCPADCSEVEAYLADFPEIDSARVLLMPQGADPAALSEKAAWLAPYCAVRGWTFCPRRQIEWFGSQRGR
jgi:7-carboxy-7-deazaguanine synthase